MDRVFFFFQAEDGIRDYKVTGVQTCALPISNQYPVKKIDNDHWEVTFDKIFSPGHEIGFSPDGRLLCMRNNLRENDCSVFDSSEPDPRNWKKIAHIEGPLWVGKYPNPFHRVCSMDG